MSNIYRITYPLHFGSTISPSSDHFWTDYVPHLRNIAYVESIAQKTFKELVEAGLDADSGQRERRRTRRGSPKERTHYFDKVLGNHHYCDGNSEGVTIGEHLKKYNLFHLQS